MKLLDSTIRAYKLNGNTISEASLDLVLNEAYAILAKNDEIAPPFEQWVEEEGIVDNDSVLSYYAKTDSGKEIRVSFSFNDMTAKIMLLSPEDEYYIGDNLLCTIKSSKAYSIENWL
jgi:hypothetical protein